MAYISYGQDIEAAPFYKDGDKLLWLPPEGDAISKLPNFKADGANVEMDGIVETSLKNLLVRSQTAIERFYAMTGGHLSFLPVNVFPDEIFAHKNVLEFGCRPDINTVAEKKGMSRKDMEAMAKTLSRRPAGGHIQLSATNFFTDDAMGWSLLVSLFKDYQDELNPAKQRALRQVMEKTDAWKTFVNKSVDIEAMMLIVSTFSSMKYGASVGMKEAEVNKLHLERRTLYGQSGSCRIKAWDVNGNLYAGLEVRSPDPSWILIDSASAVVKLMEDYFSAIAASQVGRVFNHTEALEVLNLADTNPMKLLTMNFRDNGLQRIQAAARNIKLVSPEGTLSAKLREGNYINRKWEPKVVKHTDIKPYMSGYPGGTAWLKSMLARVS